VRTLAARKEQAAGIIFEQPPAAYAHTPHTNQMQALWNMAAVTEEPDPRAEAAHRSTGCYPIRRRFPHRPALKRTIGAAP